MRELLEFMVRHGYMLVFWLVLVEQLGAPLPSVPVLLAAGALSGQHRINGLYVLIWASLACLIADALWFEAGRRRGPQVLRFVCRISLEPDNCVRRTEEFYLRHGAGSLVLAKFVPGLNTVAPPLAGMFSMRWARFFFFDGLGTFVWVMTWGGLGYVFSEQLETVALNAARLGVGLAVLLLFPLLFYLAWKWRERRRFMRTLRVARIAPEDLKARLDRGDALFIVDLRHQLDFDNEPFVIPGAFHIDPEAFEDRHAEIPRDRDVVLYCT